MTYRDFQPAFCLQDLHICSAPTCTGTETHLDIPLGWPQFCFTNLIQRRMLYGEVKNSAWERCVQPPVQPEKNRSDRTTAAEPGQSSERQSCPPPSDRTREGEENPEAPKNGGAAASSVVWRRPKPGFKEHRERQRLNGSLICA